MNVFRPRVSKKILIILVTILVAITVVNAQSDSIRAKFIKEYQAKKYGVSDEERKKIIEENLSKGMLTNEEYFRNSDYILEVVKLPNEAVKRESNIPFEDLTDEDIYIPYLVKVLHVYKGNNVQEGDTLFALAKGGIICKKYRDIDTIYPDAEFFREECKGSHPDEMDDPGINMSKTKTIIFGFETNISQYNNYRFKKIEVQNKQRAGLFFEYQNIYGLNGLHFTNYEELYEYMRQFDGINVPYMPINITPEENQKRLDNWNNIIEEKLKAIEKNKKKRLNSAKATNNLTVSIVSQQVTYSSSSGKYYLEFDVNIVGNNSATFVDNVMLNISYNTVAFGQNIKDNGKLGIA
jgi:hypothetical protein